MDSSSQTAFYITPGWIGLDSGDATTLIDSRDGVSVSLTGELRQAFLANELLAYPAFETLALADPMMARLRNTLVATNPVPLDRSVLLKGAGWTRLFVELTGQCNENCLHCYAEASPSVTDALSESEIFAVLEDGMAMGFNSVQLTGGDPLISKHCLAAATYAKQLGFPRTEIYTNGLALKGRLFEELVALDVIFAFSIYGQDPLVHDIVTRTPGSHRLTVEAIRKTVEAGLQVRIGIVDTGTAGFNLDHTLQLMSELGVEDDAVRWDVERGVGRGTFEQQSAHHGHHEYTPPALEADDISDVFNGTAAVSYTGHVYPCIFTRDRPLGHIRETSLREILERPEQVQFNVARLDDDLKACASTLTCWRCRMRSCLLSANQEAETS